MQTEVTRLLEIEYPIIQGGMAWVAEYHLAAGVSNAGGLGIIGAASAPADWVREQVREAKKLTDKPFGVNIMLMSPYADEVARVIVEEGVKVVTTGAGSPEKYMKMNGTLRCRCSRSRRMRSRRTYRRKYNDGTCSSDRRCGEDSGDRSRRDRRWKRNCSSIHAGRRRCTDGDAFRSHR